MHFNGLMKCLCVSLRNASMAGLLALSFCLSSPAFSSEATVRVAFIYNFIKFIEWPAVPPKETINLCTLDARGNTLIALQQLAGKSADNHAITVVYLQSTQLADHSLDQCQLLYLPDQTSSDIAASQRPDGMVIVADEPTDNKTGIHIALLKNPDGRIEFTIHSENLNADKVIISSQLRKLAKNTRSP